jgi:hypothetical protein
LLHWFENYLSDNRSIIWWVRFYIFLKE